MAEWSYFHTRLMPRVMGCPVPLANKELRNSAFEFFERTRAWRQWLDWFIAAEGVRQYDIDLPDGAQVVRIEKATRDGKPLKIEGAFALDKDPYEHAGSTQGLSSVDRTSIMLSSEPVAGSVIQLQASLAPSETATGIPDHLAAHYTDAIVAGALFRLRTIPNTTFANVDSAAVDIAKFQSEIGRVSALVWRTHTNEQPRSRPTWC